jgi:CRP-like cAMP-binding protein
MNKIAVPRKNSLGAVNAMIPATTAPPPSGNLLLAALPKSDYRKLRPHLESVSLPQGKDLYKTGDVVTHVYFPTEGVVALLSELSDGRSAATAVIGNEGLVGISLILEGARTTAQPCHAVALCAGHAYRLRGDYLVDEFDRGGELQHLLLRYTQALINQIAQTAMCNRSHTVTEHLCRYLLLSLDRLPDNELHMTQELIANTLGVRREGITQAAGLLQSAGLIQYQRGHITVLDRAGLEQRVCECYALIHNEYRRLLAKRTPASAKPKMHQTITASTG